MKRNKTKLVCFLAATLVITGCQAGYNDGYYRSSSRYNNSYAYGDGQPGDDYYYDYDQQPYYNDGRYQQSNGQPPMGFDDFYRQLTPYGTWVSLSPYGQVWIANVPNFQPYSTNGYWTYTTYGWTWVSNYNWGWAPFHYGRWGYNNRYGWYWVPGYEWGPAWVAWSSSSDMYGWAPLMPGMHFGVSLSLNLFPSSYWTFMQGRYMGGNNISNYYVSRSKNVTIIKNTTIINNYGMENNRRYTMGPSANDVQRHTGRSIQPMRVTSVSENSRAGVSSDELRVYRPVTRSENPASNNRTSNSTYNNRTGTSQTRSSQSTQQQQGSSQTRSSQSTQQQQGSSQTRSSQSTQQQQGSSQTRSSQSTQQQQGTSQTRRSQSTQQQQGTSPTRNSQSTQQSSSQTRSSQSTQSVYRPDPAQPKVSNSAAPQTSRQIQAAKSDNQKEERQRSSTSTTTTRSSNTNSRSSNTDSQSRSSSQPRR